MRHKVGNFCTISGDKVQLELIGLKQWSSKPQFCTYSWSLFPQAEPKVINRSIPEQDWYRYCFIKLTEPFQMTSYNRGCLNFSIFVGLLGEF